MSSRSLRLPVIAAIAALCIAAALPLVTAAQSAPAANFVEPSPSDPMGWTVDQPTINIAAGQSITWTNEGVQPHDVTADDGSFASGTVAPGATWSYEFDSPGTFTYHCQVHPWMKGTVVVAGSDTSASVAADSGS